MAKKYDHVTELIEYGAAGNLEETDVLAALLLIRVLRDKLLLDEEALIAAARAKNITWTRLATALELRSRQAAERRYRQLRPDLDTAVGRDLTQSERVEAARTQRDRRAEQQWAVANRERIVPLAQQLAAIPDLQNRADTCPKVERANQISIMQARRNGEPDPQPIRAAWPDQLSDAVEALQALQALQAAKDKAAQSYPDLEELKAALTRELARQRGQDAADLPGGTTRLPSRAPVLKNDARYARLVHRCIELDRKSKNRDAYVWITLTKGHFATATDQELHGCRAGGRRRTSR
ncbi:hypothetical protein [Streptomyces sp. NPDC002851]